MRVGQALIGLVGFFDAVAGAALLLVPTWFYETVGTFPPFNRHYAGDAGAFLLPIGIGLLVAAREPVRHRALILVGLGASWLHALNHAYDGAVHAGEGSASLADAASIVGMALLLTVGAWLAWRGTPRGELRMATVLVTGASDSWAGVSSTSYPRVAIPSAGSSTARGRPGRTLRIGSATCARARDWTRPSKASRPSSTVRPRRCAREPPTWTGRAGS
jgi:hypothetical protein